MRCQRARGVFLADDSLIRLAFEVPGGVRPLGTARPIGTAPLRGGNFVGGFGVLGMAVSYWTPGIRSRSWGSITTMKYWPVPLIESWVVCVTQNFHEKSSATTQIELSV